MAIVMADGSAVRWGQQPVPKHLIQFGPETLLQRTVRLLRTNNVPSIAITSHDNRYSLPGTTRLEFDDNLYEIDKFYANRSAWNRGGETLFLWGDCFFTNHAMKVICRTPIPDDDRGFLFFGRHGHSPFTGKPWGELFGAKVRDHDKFLASCGAVRAGIIDGSIKRGGGWELYDHLIGKTQDNSIERGPAFVEINDFTDDFDFPEDVLRFRQKWQSRLRFAQLHFDLAVYVWKSKRRRGGEQSL
jgi:hypothetical protein